MNSNKIQPKNETQDFLVSITKNCETLVQQTHKKPEETLKCKIIKARETFHFNPPIHIKGDWMIGQTDLEVYNSIFNITKENNEFELYTDTFDEFSLEELKDEVEEILNIPNFTDDHLEDETIVPRIIKACRNLRLEKSCTDGLNNLLMGYARSPFRHFESYLRIVIALDEDDTRLILKQINEKFVTYELDLGNYSIEDLQKAVYRFGDHEGTLQIEVDDLNKKTKFVLFRYGSTFGTLRFDKRSFFHTLLKIEPYWDYKPTNAIHADSPGVYTNDKIILNLKTKNKIHLKCDCIDGSNQDGVRQPILFNFNLDKPAGFKLFCQPETIQYKKNKSVLNTITLCLKDDNNKKVDFKGETLKLSKFQTGSINITRVDNVLQNGKGSLLRQICLNYVI